MILGTLQHLGRCILEVCRSTIQFGRLLLHGAQHGGEFADHGHGGILQSGQFVIVRGVDVHAGGEVAGGDTLHDADRLIEWFADAAGDDKTENECDQRGEQDGDGRQIAHVVGVRHDQRRAFDEAFLCVIDIGFDGVFEILHAWPRFLVEIFLGLGGFLFDRQGKDVILLGNGQVVLGADVACESCILFRAFEVVEVAFDGFNSGEQSFLVYLVSFGFFLRFLFVVGHYGVARLEPQVEVMVAQIVGFLFDGDTGAGHGLCQGVDFVGGLPDDESGDQLGEDDGTESEGQTLRNRKSIKHGGSL